MSRHKTPAVRRLAALAALAALGGSIALLVVALTPDVLRLVPAVVGAALAIAAAWTALTTRGLVRLISGLVCAAALAAVVVLAVQGGALGPALGALALGVVSGALGDVALPDLPAAEGRRVPPPRRAVLFMNPKSGGGKVERFDLVPRAEALGAKVVIIDHSMDLLASAEAAADGGADLIGVAGGDGSQALVAGVAARHDLPFLVIPAGTRNHLALDLHLDRDDPARALDALTDGVERRIDLGLVGERIFVNNVSFGAYAQIVREEGYREAKIATALRRLPELVGRGAPVSGLECRVPGEPPISDAQVVLISNNPYRFSNRGAGTRDRMDSGLLGVVGVRMGGGADAAKLAVAGPQRLAGWRETTATRAEVRGAGDHVDAGVDGESLALPSPVPLRVLPGALRVRLPRTGLVRAPGARSSALGAVPRLARIAFGRAGTG